MPQPHFFDANSMDWSPHPTISGILTKPFETKATHPAASVQLVRVEVGGVIATHTHAVETETAYVLAGEGLFIFDGQQQALKPGMGMTIPVGTAHSLHNTGDMPMELYAIHIPPVR